MKLELANGQKVDNPDQESVNRALESLNKDNNDYAILGDENYIQTAVANDGFLLEYQDSEGHFNSSDENLSLDTVKRVFSEYLNGENQWQNDLQWVPDEAISSCAGTSQNSSTESNTGDDLFEDLKGQAVNWAKKKIRKMFS